MNSASAKAGPDDHRWMAAAITLATRGRGLATPNPNVGCIIVKHGRVVGRGWTAAGGRPHAEAMALAEAGESARGATAYVTLEPCAHASDRGPACTHGLIAAEVARVVMATLDPDPRTDGRGIAALQAAGIATLSDVLAEQARATMAGWWSRMLHRRPYITLKLATSLDGCIAMADGSSRWITGAAARRHAHLLRARSDAILVGRGTWAADAPQLNVRLPGLEGRAPLRLMLSRTATAPEGWQALARPQDAAALSGVNDLLIEGGAGAATAFLAADLVDRLVLYRAPIMIGAGLRCLADIGLGALDQAHGRWRLDAAHALGDDRAEIFERLRKGQSLR